MNSHIRNTVAVATISVLAAFSVAPSASADDTTSPDVEISAEAVVSAEQLDAPDVTLEVAPNEDVSTDVPTVDETVAPVDESSAPAAEVTPSKGSAEETFTDPETGEPVRVIFDDSLIDVNDPSKGSAEETFTDPETGEPVRVIFDDLEIEVDDPPKVFTPRPASGVIDYVLPRTTPAGVAQRTSEPDYIMGEVNPEFVKKYSNGPREGVIYEDGCEGFPLIEKYTSEPYPVKRVVATERPSSNKVARISQALKSDSKITGTLPVRHASVSAAGPSARVDNSSITASPVFVHATPPAAPRPVPFADEARASAVPTPIKVAGGLSVLAILVGSMFWLNRRAGK